MGRMLLNINVLEENENDVLVINMFAKRVAEKTALNEAVEITFPNYRYKLTVYPGANADAIAFALKGKVRDIRNLGKNIETLRSSGRFTEEEIIYMISKLTPDEIANKTFELSCEEDFYCARQHSMR